jgi:hypothetical protein
MIAPSRALYDDMASLKKDAQAYVLKYSLERWLETHTLQAFTPQEDDHKADGDKRNLLKVSMGELEGELVQWERAISDLTLPHGVGPFDMATFTDTLPCSQCA